MFEFEVHGPANYISKMKIKNNELTSSKCKFVPCQHLDRDTTISYAKPKGLFTRPVKQPIKVTIIINSNVNGDGVRIGSSRQSHRHN